MAKSLRELYSKMGIEMEKLIFQSYRHAINPYSNIMKILGYFLLEFYKPTQKQMINNVFWGKKK